MMRSAVFFCVWRRYASERGLQLEHILHVAFLTLYYILYIIIQTKLYSNYVSHRMENHIISLFKQKSAF